MAKDEWTCPRCKQKTTDYPALSRKDNKTEICSQCGTDEAMIQWANNKPRVINEAKDGNCEVCGKFALLDKGNGTKWACEKCYYEIGNDKPKGGAQ